jgi:hypothetical protein
MTDLLALPLSIFGVIGEFFTTITIDDDDNRLMSLANWRDDDDNQLRNLANWRDFVNCAKKLDEIKRNYSFYNLNTIYSHAYIVFYDEIEGHHPGWRSIAKLLNIVRNTSTQVMICLPPSMTKIFYPHSTQQITSVFGLRCGKSPLRLSNVLSDIHKITFVNLSSVNLEDVDLLTFAGVQRLEVGGWNYLRDFSSLKNCLELDLSGTKISDVSCLGNVKKLSLANCGELSDVSALGRVKYLNLSGCTQIADVSMLGNVHTLNISFCRVTDISALGNVHVLDIHNGNNIMTKSLPYDNNVKVLTCSSSIINEIGVYSNKEKKRLLTVSGDSEGLHLLEGYRMLHLRHNLKLSSVCDLNALQDLRFTWCPAGIVVRDLPSLTTLTLNRLSLVVIDYSTLPKLTSLFISELNVKNVYDLKEPLQHVTIRNSERGHVNVCTHLRSLRLFSCDEPFYVCPGDYSIDYYYADGNVNFLNNPLT